MANIETFMNIRYKFERRRYGHSKSTRFFTWLTYRTPSTPNHEWETYGDPWPKVRLNKAELNEALHNIVSSSLRVGDRIKLNTGAEARVVGKSGYDLHVVLLNGLKGTFTIPSTAYYEVL
jgi:hypothetical protein